MPRVDGLTATERVRGRPGAPQVIVLTTYDADDHVVAALNAGAGGFLLKDTPPPEIVAAIRRVAAGDAVLSPSVTRLLIDQVTDRAAATRRTQARNRVEQLSDRERAVAIALARGQSNAEIGTDLRLSPGTVKAYVSRILTKLDLTSRIQIAILVHEAGLL
jgi:DNA-binding NarL/FixJ family response regulator